MSGGWVVVIGSGDGETTIDRAWNLAEVAAIKGLEFVVIDILIGLPDRGSRACDVEARALLGKPRSSSVFPAPIRRASGHLILQRTNVCVRWSHLNGRPG
jgi:predicted RNase H-like nuclease